MNYHNFVNLFLAELEKYLKTQIDIDKNDSTIELLSSAKYKFSIDFSFDCLEDKISISNPRITRLTHNLLED